MVRQQLAERLKQFRESNGLTIYEVGEKVGKSGKTVSAWERGRGQPDADMLLKLCEVYNVGSISEFYGVDNSLNMACSEAETELLTLFRSFNDEGQDKLLTYARDLDKTGIYKKYDSHNDVENTA